MRKPAAMAAVVAVLQVAASHTLAPNDSSGIDTPLLRTTLGVGAERAKPDEEIVSESMGLAQRELRHQRSATGGPPKGSSFYMPLVRQPSAFRRPLWSRTLLSVGG